MSVQLNLVNKASADPVSNFLNSINLNPPQLEAVKHVAGPILVLAGAGSGKTRVLTARIANLILEHGVRPGEILAVTFTNKATEEMRLRLSNMLGEDARHIWAATFHSAALRILRRHATLLAYTNDFVVYDDDDSRGLIKQIIKSQNIDEKKYPPTMFQRVIDSAKNDYILPDQFKRDTHGYGDIVQAELYQEYQTRLLKANAMDFGDLLVNVLVLFEKHPEVLERYQRSLRFVLVDEYQDTNRVQYLFIKLISKIHKNVFVVGDDDQSIYSFRGANIENILNFERDYPNAKVITLDQNYRSTQNILNAANNIIVKNRSRKHKKLWTDQGEGQKIQTYLGDDERAEAEFVAQNIASLTAKGAKLSDFAVFYRTNAQSRALEEALLDAGIPYRIYGGLKFYDRKEIRDILGYLRLLINPADNQAFLRVVNTPARGIGAQGVKSITDFATQNNLNLYESALNLANRSAGLSQFVKLLEELRLSLQSCSLADLIRDLIQNSGYGPMLQASKDPTAISRIENLSELVAVATEFSAVSQDYAQALREFLDRAALTSGGELPVEDSKDAKLSSANEERPQFVALMTLHLAKGLEFPFVFLTGFEEGLLPHYRSLEDPIALEEERRLCYVGFTRAMQELFVTRAGYRSMFSSGDYSRTVSRFGRDIPDELVADSRNGFMQSGIWQTEHDPDEYSLNLTRPPNRKSTNSRAGLTSKITTADGLAAAVDHAKGHPELVSSEAKVGLMVIHPSFGQGVIEELIGDPNGDPRKFKLSVRFDGFSDGKTLIFKFARLALGQLS